MPFQSVTTLRQRERAALDRVNEAIILYAGLRERRLWAQANAARIELDKAVRAYARAVRRAAC